MRTNNTLKIPWNILDIILIFSLILFSVTITSVLIFTLISTQKIEFKIFIYIFPLFTIFITYFWLKKKYNISWKHLGIRKGNHSFEVHVAIGILAAIVLILIIRFIPFWYEAVLKKNSIQIDSYIPIILLPFSPSGFARFVLTPFGEEIFLRGFVYGYLKQKNGLLFGSLCQATLSTMMHLMYIKDAVQTNSLSILSYVFMINIIFGLLYEKTNSIYSSIICHSTFNYFLFLYFIQI